MVVAVGFSDAPFASLRGAFCSRWFFSSLLPLVGVSSDPGPPAPPSGVTVDFFSPADDAAPPLKGTS